MEPGSIQREIHIDATPEVVFDVVTNPAHVREWWADEADFVTVAGTVGELRWGDTPATRAVASITVVEADPPRLFSFRWLNPDGVTPTSANSMLVTFEIVPSGTGALLRVTESGFREVAWEAAVLEEYYQDHCVGWDRHLARLEEYLAQMAAAR